MPLKLVPPSTPTPAEQVSLRAKRQPRPDCTLQCNRCGGRTSLTTRNGVQILNGRKTRGTVIDEDVCAECWRQGICVSMLPTIKPA